MGGLRQQEKWRRRRGRTLCAATYIQRGWPGRSCRNQPAVAGLVGHSSATLQGMRMGQIDADIAGAGRWRTAPVISDPIDDGTDAEALAARLLLAAADVADLYIQSPYPSGRRTWHGCVDGSSQRDCVLSLHGQDLDLDIELSDVLAVSHCSDDDASGVCFIGRDGPLLTLWSTRTAAFERWLAVHVPDYIEPSRSGRQ